MDSDVSISPKDGCSWQFDYDDIQVGEGLCDHYSKALETRTLTRHDAEDLLYQIIYNRNKPRTRCQLCAFCFVRCFQCCFVYCCPPCPPCIIRKVAFAPPKPSYDLIRYGRPKNGDYRMRLKRNIKDMLGLIYPQFAQVSSMVRCFFVPSSTGKGKRIACVYCRSWLVGDIARWTVLLSHTNGEDLGLMITRIIAMSQQLSVDVVSYDYSGYGLSDGPCSEKALYENVENVYEFMIGVMKIPRDRILLIGSSLGTAATIHLASKNVVPGIVLQGSFSSALRIVCPSQKRTCCMDQFVNVNKIRSVKSPTLFVHGENDTMFSVDHALTLRALCPGAADFSPLVIRGGDHIDFDEHEEYWRRMKRFVNLELQAQSTAACDEDSDTDRDISVKIVDS